MERYRDKLCAKCGDAFSAHEEMIFYKGMAEGVATALNMYIEFSDR